MLKPAILVVTGASGVGKTAAVRCLDARNRQGVRCFYFDTIGVPSDEVMKRDFGGGEAWQADATRRWLSRLSAETMAGNVSVLDGQTRPSFIQAALRDVERVAVRIVLIECSSRARRARLETRGQPGLATSEMDLWAAYLRGQADALGLSVIDTTRLGVEAVADELESEIHALQASPWACA